MAGQGVTRELSGRDEHPPPDITRVYQWPSQGNIGCWLTLASASFTERVKDLFLHGDSTRWPPRVAHRRCMEAKPPRYELGQ